MGVNGSSGARRAGLVFWLGVPVCWGLGVGCADDSGKDAGLIGGESGSAGEAGTTSGGSDQGTGGEPGDAGRPGVAGSGEATEELWASCPAADEFPWEESWPHVVQVTPDAVYCASFGESRTLEQELATKARLRVAPGSYRFPDEDAAGLGLPACLQFQEDGSPVSATPERMTYERSEFAGSVTHSYVMDERTAEPERRFQFALSIDVDAASAETPTLVLDGSLPAFDLLDPAGWVDFRLCEAGDNCIRERVFTDCSNDGWTLNRHDVVLEGAVVSFELQLGPSIESFESQEPGAFLRASGTFRDEDFDQQSYFRLIYAPSHHHFERDFAVLFDEPIDGACGLEVLGLEPFEANDTPDEAYAVDCDLTQLETLELTSHELTETRP